MPITFDGRFSTNNAFITGYGVQANGIDSTAFNYSKGIPGRMELVPDPLGSGVLVCRHTLYDTDAVAAAGQRAEYYYQPSSAPGTTLWYWWSTLILQWQGDRNFCIFQQHDTPDGSDLSKTPTMLGYLTADGWYIQNNSSDVNALTTPAKLAADRDMLRLRFPLGRWNDFVMKVTWSATNGVGTVDMWMNRRRLLVERGKINSYNDVVGPHIKQGIYDYYHTGAFGTRQSFSKGVVVGDTFASFDAFMAAMGSSDTELEMTAASRTAVA